MKHIVPYRTLKGALNALDNGGRFYNVFTKAKDEVITDSELCKAAGVFSQQDYMGNQPSVQVPPYMASFSYLTK